MSSINDLPIPAGAVDVPDDIPEQFGSFAPPPQPGPCRFRLPSKLEAIWELCDVRNPDAQKALGGADKGLMASFSTDTPLTITQSRYTEADGTDSYANEAFSTRVTIIPRKRDKEGHMVSDMFYLLRALDHDMSTVKTWSQKDWANALMQHAGQEFAADIEWSARCRDDQPKRVWTEDGLRTEEDTEDKGCGNTVYQRDIPMEEGYYKEQFECTDCGSILRAFANLSRFRSISK